MLVLYSRKNCSLCDVFETELAACIRQENLFTSIDKKDVDSNELWVQQYGTDVPVLTLDDRLVCQHFFDREKFLSAFG